MKKLFRLVLLAITAVSAFSVFAADTAPVKPLEVGVVPYISARAVVTNFEPLRVYLERVLGQPVKIYTSTGFKQFYKNAERGDYDLVISAAHFARLLQKDNKFKPLVKLYPAAHSLLMTKLDSPLKTPMDLKGQVLAVPDQLAFSSMVALAWLRENGLQPGVDFKILDVPSFPSALLAVQKGDANAAISASPVIAQIPKELRESLKTLADVGEFLQFIFLTHPRMELAASERISKELLNFNNDTGEGKQFFNSTGFGAITALAPKDMGSLDRYVAETKRLMEEAP